MFDFLRTPDDTFVSRLTGIHDKMLGNTAFANPPVDLAAFLAAITAYSAAVVVALDGGKQAIAVKNKLRAGLVKMAEQLGHYVEAHSNNDPATFTSSGFQIRSTTPVPAQPLAQPTIISVDQGKMGELLVSFTAVDKARMYEIHYMAVLPGGAPSTTFAPIAVASALKPVPVGNLTPGTTYSFQVRAFGKLGFTELRQPVQRMCIESDHQRRGSLWPPLQPFRQCVNKLNLRMKIENWFVIND